MDDEIVAPSAGLEEAGLRLPLDYQTKGGQAHQATDQIFFYRYWYVEIRG